jgi:hypothetical protein
VTAERDRRAAAAFAGQISRFLREAGYTVTPASSRHREGLRATSQARSRCRITADLDSAREARDLIDHVIASLHRDHWRTERRTDDSVLVFRTGTSMDSADLREGA